MPSSRQVRSLSQKCYGNGSLGQIGANANEAKVFKAHATPSGLCDNLINALKLLANQQKDGDSPIQSIVTGLHAKRRRGIMDGLRRFINADNHRAVDVGHMRQGTRSLEVQEPNFSEKRRSGKGQIS